MSVASESLNSALIGKVKKAERDAREIAKEYGAKIRNNRISGIDVTFSDGEKKHYHGWINLRNELVKVFDLAD